MNHSNCSGCMWSPHRQKPRESTVRVGVGCLSFIKSRQRWGMQVLQERGPYSISSEETNIIFDSEKNHREVGFTMFIKTGHLQRPGQALAIRSTFLLLRFFGRKGKATPRGKDLQNFHPSQGFQIGGRTSIVVHSPANVQVSLASA